MKADDLVVGQTYFTITFQRGNLQKPIIMSYEYVEQAKREDGYSEDGFLFRYLPAVQYQMEGGELFPGEEELSFFAPLQIHVFLDWPGLIQKLVDVKDSRNK